MAIYDHFSPFLANCMFILHKTEVQTVFLRDLTILNLNWHKMARNCRKTVIYFVIFVLKQI